MIRVEKQADGKYTVQITEGNVTSVKRGLTQQEVVYELEMQPYVKEGTDGVCEDPKHL